MNYLNIGHRVIVRVPLEDRAAHLAVAKYNGQEMEISFRKVINGRGNYTYYELLGAESESGFPYSFIREWLIPL